MRICIKANSFHIETCTCHLYIPLAKILIILHKTKKKEEKVSKGGHSCDRVFSRLIIEKINFFLISLLEKLTRWANFLTTPH